MNVAVTFTTVTLCLAALAPVSGFQPRVVTKSVSSSLTTQNMVSRQPTRLAARPDASQAIQDAMKISKEKGAQSEEARVAWEAVEEISASDLSPALATIDPNGESLTPEQVKVQDYAYQVSSLAYLLQDTQEKMEQIKGLVESIQAMELDVPSLSRWDDSAGNGAARHLKTVLREAKAAAEVYGSTSNEAAMAWNRVEECAADDDECSVDTYYRYSAAALKAHHLYDAVIDSSLLHEALEALGTLESLRRSIRIEDQRLQS